MFVELIFMSMGGSMSLGSMYASMSIIERMSLAASLRSVPHSNWIMMAESPVCDTESTCSTPLMVETASSMISVTLLSMSSDPAPG